MSSALEYVRNGCGQAGEEVADENDRVEELKAWRDVGQSFVYLGKEMVVCRHSRLEMNDHFCQVIPEVQARYVDNHGVIHTIAISEKEALTLAKSEA